MARTILDGAMGTMLQGAGLKIGEKPELFALRNPDAVLSIQKDYVKAGSDVLYSNTFGANRKKLESTGVSPEQVISANVKIAKEAASSADKKVKVALDIGPIGELMESLGTLSFDEAYDIFKEMVIAGEKSGADLVVFETFTDLQELRTGILAAKENCNLPVWATMSFEENGRTFTGVQLQSMAMTLDALGVDAMGINCSLGPDEILPLMEKLRTYTEKPLIAKPNAGLPDPKTGTYFIIPAEFSKGMSKISDIGVEILGGCCGTTPAFIKALSEAVGNGSKSYKKTEKQNGVCSSSNVVTFDKINVIGERINPTGKKKLRQALASHDMDYVMKLAMEQAEAGAAILDINVGVPDCDEPALMKEVVRAVQSVVDLPLMIDSSSPEAIETGLRYFCGKAIINSVNADDERLRAILPIAKKYGAAVVGLVMEKNLPSTVDERMKNAQKIVDKAVEAGIDRSDLIIDALTLTISAQQDQAANTLEAVRKITKEMNLHTTLGVSNVAFGLPQRNRIAASFLTMALQNGLDLPILNPNDQTMMDALATYRALSGSDKDCQDYISRFSQTEAEPTTTPTKAEMTLDEAILKGLGQEARLATEKLLETEDPMEIIEKRLIPALDKVGDLYESQKLFLPQLINAANAAGKGFDLLKSRMKKNTAQSKGKIIIATVEGDIHDIGKNIVKVVLENYGYQVIDLGKDVPVETVVRRTIEEDAHLVALSALMTTTVQSMKRTIEALKASGHRCVTMVGGAVLTEEYAKAIGADYYSKDPKQSADIARRVLG